MPYKTGRLSTLEEDLKVLGLGKLLVAEDRQEEPGIDPPKPGEEHDDPPKGRTEIEQSPALNNAAERKAWLASDFGRAACARAAKRLELGSSEQRETMWRLEAARVRLGRRLEGASVKDKPEDVIVNVKKMIGVLSSKFRILSEEGVIDKKDATMATDDLDTADKELTKQAAAQKPEEEEIKSSTQDVLAVMDRFLQVAQEVDQALGPGPQAGTSKKLHDTDDPDNPTLVDKKPNPEDIPV
jgi:hypothetical protein